MSTRLTLILALVIPNLIGFLLMGIDKEKARQGAFRVPESVLFCVALIGGSVGCLLGMFLFRHKTRKPGFLIGMPAILLLQLACFFILWRSELQFRLL